MEPATAGKRAAAAARIGAVDSAGATLAPRRWLLWAPVALGLGVQSYFIAPTEPSVAALTGLGLAALGGLLVAALALRRGAALAAGAALALALAAVGFAWAGAQARAVAAPVLAGPVAALVEGRVRELSQSASGRPRLLLDRVRIWGTEAARTPARVRVTLGARTDAAAFAPGQRVSVMARLNPPAGAGEPGGFDFARAAWFQRLGAVGVADGRVALLDAAPPADVWERARLARDRFRARVSGALRAAMPAETGAFAAAVATGDRSALPPEALQALRDSGLAHLLAISGLHMAMVCGLAFAATRLLVTATPGVGARWPAKTVAAIAGLAVGALYLGLSGASVATQRAFVMAAVALVAVLAMRPAVTLRALAAAALAVLLLAPHSLVEVGFQMSFAATLALVAAYEAARARGWLRPAPGARAWLLRYVAALAASSLIAGLATGPFAAYHFNRVAAYGLLSNLAALPAMGLAVAPGLLAAAALAPLGLEAWPLRLADAGIAWILWVARTVAETPGAVAAAATPHPAALWCVSLGGLALCLGRGALRLAGLAPLAVAAALWWGAAGSRPPLLIAPQGAAVGLMLEGERAVTASRQGRFAADGWLRRDGAQQAAPAFVTDGAWRIAARRDGLSVAVYLGDALSVSRLRQRCAAHDVVVMPRARAPVGAGPCVVLDAPTLARLPALAGGIHADRIILDTAQTGRLWSRIEGAGPPVAAPPASPSQ